MSHFKLSIPKSSCSPEIFGYVQKVPTKLDLGAMTREDYAKHAKRITDAVATVNAGQRAALEAKHNEGRSKPSIFAHMYGATNQLGNIQSTGSDHPAVGLSARLLPLIENALTSGALAIHKTDNTRVNMGKRGSLVLAERLVHQLYPELCVHVAPCMTAGEIANIVARVSEVEVAPMVPKSYKEALEADVAAQMPKLQCCGQAAAPKPEQTEFERLLEAEGMGNLL